ncbi:MAG: glycine cleavage system aminomethyltransferase GcvT [Saprospiraceae bacterium]|nr:glycine cleavage system aminomethyltransferase GcvT [Bacteroidia bacterium]NNE16005.1 glycine cleavage system aminomethyltransferase GcvT [Saprospiraceae bacterium]NNL90705.1 glycine cleavage system aminomethyltransferase GcvT [Saprospiraceae bacterium]
MKETPLTQEHIKLGARMMPFAGYNMPVSYSTINEEHENVRNNVGLFDVSHMGQFFIKGSGALKLIQKVSSNNAAKLVVGQAQYACFPNDKGGIVDDFLTYKISDEEYMLVVNASNIGKDLDWITKANTYNCTIEDRSDSMALLALQGPKASATLSKLTDIKVDQIPYYYFAIGEICGLKNVIVSATGYTGSGGFELYLDNKDAVTVWNQLLEVGKEESIMPIGLGARDTLRLEMGFCLYGNDINDETSPIEAGLGWITKTKKEADFFSKEIFQKQRAEGITKKLVAFKVKDRRVPRNGYEIADEDGNVIGNVTSGTMSPSLEIPIGLGYVPKENSKVGTAINIKIRNKLLEAEIVKLPFYKVEE